MANRMIGYRVNKDRQEMYNKLVAKYPSLPLELGAKSLDKVLTLLIEEANNNENNTNTN